MLDDSLNRQRLDELRLVRQRAAATRLARPSSEAGRVPADVSQEPLPEAPFEPAFDDDDDPQRANAARDGMVALPNPAAAIGDPDGAGGRVVFVDEGWRDDISADRVPAVRARGAAPDVEGAVARLCGVVPASFRSRPGFRLAVVLDEDVPRTRFIDATQAAIARGVQVATMGSPLFRRLDGVDE